LVDADRLAGGLHLWVLLADLFGPQKLFGLERRVDELVQDDPLGDDSVTGSVGGLPVCGQGDDRLEALTSLGADQVDLASQFESTGVQ
jgi:hypothetical protein